MPRSMPGGVMSGHLLQQWFGFGSYFCRRRRLLVRTPDGHTVEVVGCLHPVHHELAPSIYPAFKKGPGEEKATWVPGNEEPMERGP